MDIVKAIYQRVIAMSLVLAMGAVPCVWANDNDRGGYQPVTGQSPAQPASGAPSGAILAYQPIPTGALAMAPSSQSHMSGAGVPSAVPFTQPGQSTYNYTTWLVGEGPYTLGRDDVIQIQARNQPEFSGDFIVGPDGYIQYNYIGDIPVAGMTKYEIEQVITKLLERYIRMPVVNVVIMSYNSKAVYVIGEVNRPGKYLMRGDVIKLREAIIAAGLPTETAALWRTHIIKPDIKTPLVRKVNLKKILYGGRLQQDVNLYPGEIIVVPSTVLSAVNRFLSQLLNPFTHAAAAAALGAGL